MQRLLRRALSFCAVGLLAAPAAALADHANRESFGMVPLGHSPNPASFLEDPAGPAPAEVNSDLAFWKSYTFNGNYDGFRIINTANRSNPREISHTRCQGNQGDIVVYGNILVRSWNSPAPAATAEFPLAECDGQPVPEGFEGLHVFDISNKRNPRLVASVQTPSGSHTLTGVPDLANRRFIVYNQGSGSVFPFVDIVEVPFGRLEEARLVRSQELAGGRGCHDSGVILGDVNMMACASGSTANVWDIGENAHPGGSLENPVLLYTISEPGVGDGTLPDHRGNWHSATFTWDGEVLILGWEPGGGSQPECEATDPAVTKSAFFYDANTGEKLGQWTLPRAQTAAENCTIHNYNVVPIRDRYIMVGGHYQAGTWVVDFTDPADPWVRAYSDPAPIEPTQLGGAWSSYWYNGFIFESSITEGVNIFRLEDERTKQRAKKLRHLNPQTQEFSLSGLPANALEAAEREQQEMAAPFTLD